MNKSWVPATILISALGAACIAGFAAQPRSSQPEGDKVEAPDGTPMDVVKTTSCTFSYQDLKIGDGAEAKADSIVTIHYHGTLASGEVFDSTRGKEAATFPLNKTVPGVQAGIIGMKAGGIRVIRVPHQLAYGEKDTKLPGSKKVIPARSELVFAVELKAVK